MRHLVVGMGQIGTAVHKALAKSDGGVESYDPAKNPKKHKADIAKAGKIDIMHIAFPYTEGFVQHAKDYIKEFKPDYTVVYSTVQIGTCRQLGPKVFHSPVVGRHPNLFESVMLSTRWIGANGKDAHPVDKLWKSIGVKVRVVSSTDATEFIKIRSTSKFAINLVWTDYEKSIADDIGMDFEVLKDFDRDYNDLYRKLDMDWAQMFILYPPNGRITKHCVIPNAELLNEKYPTDLLEKVIAMKPKKS